MSILNGIYNGTSVYTFPFQASGQADDFLDSVIQSGDYSSVVNIVMVPTALFKKGEDANTGQLTITFPDSLDGYTPRNKKLLSFPYAFMNVDTFEDNQDYRYEWLHGYKEGEKTTTFFYSSCLGPNPEAVFYPRIYNGLSAFNGQLVGVTMNAFPQCCFPIDSYRAWLAQKATSQGLQIASQAANLIPAVAGALAGPAGTAAAYTTKKAFQAASAAQSAASASAVSSVTSMIGLAGSINQLQRSQAMGSHVQGNQVNSVAVGTRAKKVIFKKMSITSNYAKSIDDFFDRFGYAADRLKVPNRSVRPHWCYTQTKDCTVIPTPEGLLPGVFARQIESIYNKGITFWKSINEVGNYSLDNTV